MRENLRSSIASFTRSSGYAFTFIVIGFYVPATPRTHLRHQLEELASVLHRQVRHRLHPLFVPQRRVREGGDIAHVDARAHHDAALFHRLQRRHHQRTLARENDARIQLFGGKTAAASRPARAQRPRKLLLPRVPVAREHEAADAHVASQLDHDVRGGAEAVQSQRLRRPRLPQRSVPDQTGAQKRRRLQRRVVARNRETEARVRHTVLREPAVLLVARVSTLVRERKSDIALSHRFSFPSTQYSHFPQHPPNHGTPICSLTDTVFTFFPAFSTIPTI